MRSPIPSRREYVPPLSNFKKNQAATYSYGKSILRTGRTVLLSLLSLMIIVLFQTKLAFCLQKKLDFQDNLYLSSDQIRSEKLADVWVIAEGSVPFGDDTTLGDAKAKSRDYARREAVQQAVGTFVQSQSIVYNFQLAEDLIQTTVRGFIIEEHVLQEGAQIVGAEGNFIGLIYVTKLKARVKPVQAERKGNIAVKTSLNKTMFMDGEEMEIRVTANRDVYLHIFSIGQDDSVTVLFPNQYVTDNLVKTQKEFIFPSESQRIGGLRLRVFSSPTSKKSIERIKVIGTTTKIDLIKGRFQEGTFQVYAGSETGLVTELLKELAMLDESDWAEATVAYEVKDKQ